MGRHHEDDGAAVSTPAHHGLMGGLRPPLAPRWPRRLRLLRLAFGGHFPLRGKYLGHARRVRSARTHVGMRVVRTHVGMRSVRTHVGIARLAWTV